MNLRQKIKDTLTVKLDKAFGLDISDRSVEIIELEKVFSFSAKTYGRVQLEPGIVENGKIIKPDDLAIKIKALLKDAKPRKVSTNKTIVSLPESQVFIESFVIDTKVKNLDITEIVTQKITLSLPLSIDKMYWDFILKPLPEKNKGLIIFVGVPKDIATGYVKFCNSIGLEVVSLSVESLSLARAILKKSDRQSLIIDIGARSTNLGFYDSNDKINMSANIPLAGEQFSDAIKNSLKIEMADADALKFKFGFKDVPENNIRPIILPILENLLKEIKAAIKYYEETFKQKLDDVYLIGGASLTPGIVELIKRDLNRDIQMSLNNHNVNLSPLANKNIDFSIYSNVIGLGMLGASGEFIDINLLKKMPKNQVNSVDRLNLFKLGYLSRVNTIRMIFNNKYVLIILIIMIAVIFAVLLQQAKSFGF